MRILIGLRAEFVRLAVRPDLSLGQRCRWAYLGVGERVVLGVLVAFDHLMFFHACVMRTQRGQRGAFLQGQVRRPSVRRSMSAVGGATALPILVQGRHCEWDSLADVIVQVERCW